MRGGLARDRLDGLHADRLREPVPERLVNGRKHRDCFRYPVISDNQRTLVHALLTLAVDDVRRGVLQVARDVLDESVLRRRVEDLLPERARLLEVD